MVKGIGAHGYQWIQTSKDIKTLKQAGPHLPVQSRGAGYASGH